MAILMLLFKIPGEIVEKDRITPTVFILAAGKSTRFGGYPKQLLELNGETLLRRTIRLIREINPKIPIYVVAFRKELFYKDVIVINTHGSTETVSESILFTEPYWGQRNVFLTGDAVFYPESLREIIYSTGYFSAGKVYKKEHSGERVAIGFDIKDHEKVCDVCVAAGKNHGLRWFCISHHPIVKKLIETEYPLGLRPVVHFGVYHIILKVVNFYTLTNHLELSDATTDIDTPEEYQDYLKLMTARGLK